MARAMPILNLNLMQLASSRKRTQLLRKQWWAKMQPSWRECESLIRALPADADWELIVRGGPNGLALVVMALFWWIHATKDDEELDVEILNAIEDVNWVFIELRVVPAANSDRSKLARETEDEDLEGSKSKKHVHFLP
ncbi:hypothetical protein F5888DRAFT_1800820 [Russula emetica]|nr:hypothetical protein F5888DRAFT_1800820 [Russula emetica]